MWARHAIGPASRHERFPGIRQDQSKIGWLSWSVFWFLLSHVESIARPTVLVKYIITLNCPMPGNTGHNIRFRERQRRVETVFYDTRDGITTSISAKTEFTRWPPRLLLTREGVGGQFTENTPCTLREIAHVPEAPAKCFGGDRGRAACRLFETLVDAVEAQSRQIGHG